VTVVPAVILGGGLAGLQLRRLLHERGVETVVLESREMTGGLCRTISKGDWSWDVGPHAFYSRDPAIMSEYRALPIEYRAHARRVRVHHRGRAVNYPFENGLADLPFGDRWECVSGYLRASMFGERPFRNLHHWIEHGLGDGIARHFMLPYNRKIWSVPLQEISMGLVKNKIEPEPPWKIVRNALIPGTVGRGYQSRFIYPRTNGAGAIPDAVAKASGGEIATGVPVRSLEKTERGWRVCCERGRRLEAERVVSTIPIPSLIDALPPGPWKASRDRFKFNDTIFVAVGLKEGRRFRRFGDCHWVFFAGPESFYRLTFMNALDPARLDTVVAEITVKGEEADAQGRVIRDLLAAGILGSEDDIGLVAAHREHCTYPIQTLDLDRDRAALERELEPLGVFLLGRSGRWDYVNTDGIFARVRAFAEAFA